MLFLDGASWFCVSRSLYNLYIYIIDTHITDLLMWLIDSICPICKWFVQHGDDLRRFPVLKDLILHTFTTAAEAVRSRISATHPWQNGSGLGCCGACHRVEEALVMPKTIWMGHGLPRWTPKDPKSVAVGQFACPWLRNYMLVPSHLKIATPLWRVARQSQLVGCMSPLT